ncbi:MAG: glycerol-3-phosphate 1-O-acyltransferase PlsY [Gammaproteobacteria bacterium]|nr:glycerol-3-phosphate 1-O-acyltransferase PlsY [Gammaproteobacteria bacterium]
MLNIALPLLAYLFGSISSAIVVCRLMSLPDPRSLGSHNPGATNVLRFGGKKAAAITLAGDFLKGLIPVLAAGALGGDSVVIASAGGGAFLGHLYPLFFRFQGGKGVATAAGVLAGLSVTLIALLLAVWLSSALLFRYSSVAALTAAVAAPWLVWYLLPGPGYLTMSLAMVALLFWRHRGNLRRLAAGEESKIRLRTGG